MHATTSTHASDPSATLPRRCGTRLATVLAVALGAIALTACANLSPSATPRAAAAAGGEAGAAAGEGGAAGEAAASAYVNARFHYRVDAPGPMKEAADGSASYAGAGERLAVTVVTGSSASDPTALATAELNRLRAATQGFSLVSGPTATTISGRPMIRVVYRWSDGTNAVTGQPNALTSSLYVIPKDTSTVALLTYSVSTSQYDPQGSDDVATSFTWQ